MTSGGAASPPLSLMHKEREMHHHSDPAMQACVDECLSCYKACTQTVFHHCLEVGGEHASTAHLSLMTACAEICRTAAHFMLIGSAHHKHLCRECAEICEQCASDCERLGDMQDCVDACRACAASCRAMAA